MATPSGASTAEGLRAFLREKAAAAGKGGGGDGGGRRGKTERFLPGRSYFTYRVEEDDDFCLQPCMPSMVARSKSELQHARFRYVMKLADDAPIIERLAGVLGYVRRGGGERDASAAAAKREKRRAGKKGPAPAPAPAAAPAAPVVAAPVDEEEDIFAGAGTDFDFAGAGDGDLLQVSEDKPQPASAPAPTSNYFGDGDADGVGRQPAQAAGVSRPLWRDLEDEEDEDTRELKAKKHEALGKSKRMHGCSSLPPAPVPSLVSRSPR